MLPSLEKMGTPEGHSAVSLGISRSISFRIGFSVGSQCWISTRKYRISIRKTVLPPAPVLYSVTMPYRAQVIDIELSRPLEPILQLGSYSHVQGLIRFHGVPLGYVQIPVSHGTCAASTIAQAIFPQYSWVLSQELIQHRLAQPELQTWNIAELLDLPPAPLPPLPSITIAFCPNQTADLKPCLDALQQLNYPGLEVLFVESHPQTDQLREWVNQHYSQIQYWATTQPGLNAARNLAIEKAQGEIIAFTDERAIVDAAWIKALGTAFAEHPSLMAVTGLVVPDEIETESQALFEAGYGLGRGFERRWHQLDLNQSIPWSMLGTMQVGAGVNMAFRRRLFEQIGKFDLALDQPNLTWGGGDWEMFCRVLLAGQPILYEPSAIVRYRAPREYEQLRTQLTQTLIAFYAYINAGISRYPEQWLNFVCLGLWKLARLATAYLRPGVLPRALVTAELRGVWQSWRRYQAASVAHLSPAPESCHQSPNSQPEDSAPHPLQSAKPAAAPAQPKAMAVCTVDLAHPLPDLTEICDYKAVRVFVAVGAVCVGSIDIEHCYQSVSAARLRQAIAAHLHLDLLALPHHNRDIAWTEIQTAFTQHWTPALVPVTPQPLPPLPPQASVSIIITTCDRPADLANCLRHLQAQKTIRPVEIVVADNRPASGLTPPVVAQFPGVKLVQESRPGGAYGRNAAIVVSTGEIIVTVDDDVTVPADWLEKLIAPFARPEVMVVTGNVLPLELETPAQVLFETLKGGLGEGFKPFEVDKNWWTSFQQISPPTWDLGVSANAAFRASIFSHPEIGLMDEVLGPGTPTVGGEENHLIYKVLRAGYTLVYEPAAFVWHKHRRDLPAFYKQIYGHMKGGTAYHLLLWLQEKDRRGLRQLVVELPNYHVRQILGRLKGQNQTPWRLLWSEVAGYFAGYWGYWQSCQRVKQQGRSAPYIPIAERAMQIETRIETPIEESVKTLVEEALMEDSIQIPLETLVEALIETPVEALPEVPVEDPVEDPVEASLEASLEASVEVTLESLTAEAYSVSQSAPLSLH